MNPSPSAASSAGPIAKPPLLPSPRLAIQRFGEHEAGAPTVYIFFDVLDELLFHARFRAEPSAVLLTGGWYAGGAGPYIEVQGFMEAMYIGCTRDWLATLQHRYAILHAHLAATSPQVSILGWAHGVPASRARMDIEALRVHLSFFNLSHQIYLAIDPDAGELAVYRRGADGAMRNIGFNVVARRRDVERIARELSATSSEPESPGPRESSVAWQAAMTMLGAELGRAGRQSAEAEPPPPSPDEAPLQPPLPSDSEPTRVRGATAIGIPAMVDEDWALAAPPDADAEPTRARFRTPPPAPQEPPLAPPDEVTQAIPRDDTAISIPPGSDLARSVLTPSPPASPARRMVDERAVEAEIQAAVEAARQRQRPAGAPPTEDSFISALKSIMESTSKRAPREGARPSSAEQLASLLPPPPPPSRPAPGELFHYRRIAELPDEATRVEPTPPEPPPAEPLPQAAEPPPAAPPQAAAAPLDEPEEWQYTLTFGSGRYRSVSREEAEQLRQQEATTLSPAPSPPPAPAAPPPPPESRPGDPAERERLRRILGVVRDALVEKHVEQSGTRWPVLKPNDEATRVEPPPDAELARSGSRPPSGAELKAKLDQLRKLRDSGRHYTIERDRAFKKADGSDEPEEPQ